jgi:hypothetical protein
VTSPPAAAIVVSAQPVQIPATVSASPAVSAAAPSTTAAASAPASDAADLKSAKATIVNIEKKYPQFDEIDEKFRLCM